MKLFSVNIIFLDTEFSSFDPYRGEILSIGMVKVNGEELYCELEYDGVIDPWPQEHIVPFFTGPQLSREEAVEKIITFVGPDKPYMVAFVAAFDAVYLYKLFTTDGSLGVDNHPFHWMPVDFASMLFGAGIDPEHYMSQQSDLFTKWGIDVANYRNHHALDDAKLMREVYLRMANSV
mgnify:CR=1 FL=1